MHTNAEMLLAIGGILLLGLAADFVGRHTPLPRVTVLLILGIAVGDEGLSLIPDNLGGSFEVITDIALLMVGFLLGGRLTMATFRQSATELMCISLAAALGTALLVTLALLAAGMPPAIAIPLGCIAAATAPAATVDTVLEYGRDTPFSRLLLRIVAVDDAWALILLSLGLALVSVLTDMQDVSLSLRTAGYEITGALLLGMLLGLPAAYLTGRIRPGQPMLIEALGLVFICGGLAFWLDVSFILSTMAMGAVITNLARHHDYPFHEIENIEWPFMVIFFILAGASLELSMLSKIGFAGAVYLVARVLGKLLGAWAGARACRAPREVQCWMGLALMPQAGVAIGMALMTANQYPEYRQTILSIVVSTTVVFELAGPVLTRLALKNTGQH